MNMQTHLHYEYDEILPHVTRPGKCLVTSVRSSEDPGQFQGRVTKGTYAAHQISGGF